jgi:hypothetical protein
LPPTFKGKLFSIEHRASVYFEHEPMKDASKSVYFALSVNESFQNQKEVMNQFLTAPSASEPLDEQNAVEGIPLDYEDIQK